MKTQNAYSTDSLTPAGIEAIMLNARAQRAEVMRAALTQVPALFKRFTARFHTHRRPNRGAWA